MKKYDVVWLDFLHVHVCIYLQINKDHKASFFLFSGSRESLPYFSEKPNKNKSALAEFYFPLLLHYFVKNEIKMTFQMNKKNTKYIMFLINSIWLGEPKVLHSFMLGQVFIHSFMLGQLLKKVYNIHA